MSVRGFEVVRDEKRAHPDKTPVIPVRKTDRSAGYDFTALESATISPGQIHHFMTDIKAYMLPDEILILNVRSSIGFKKGLRLINTQGWIDSDFYSNPDNDGNIGLGLFNPLSFPVHIEEGERIAQGIFLKYLMKDGDENDPKEVRIGGVGSTGSK